MRLAVLGARVSSEFWKCPRIADLSPLEDLPGLQLVAFYWNQRAARLFTAKRIDDDRIEPIGELIRLEALRFPARQFTTRQVAWLPARLPASLESASLAPLVQLERPLELDGRARDVLLVGKRKPFLNSVTDEARIRKHVDGFAQMVDDFRRDPTLKPD